MRTITTVKTAHLAAFVRAAHRLTNELINLEFSPSKTNTEITIVSYTPLYDDTHAILMIMYLDALQKDKH